MIDYQQELAKLSPDIKIKLWSEVKDLSFSENTKYRMIYYKARKLGYLTK